MKLSVPQILAGCIVTQFIGLGIGACFAIKTTPLPIGAIKTSRAEQTNQFVLDGKLCRNYVVIEYYTVDDKPVAPERNVVTGRFIKCDREPLPLSVQGTDGEWL